MYEVFRSTLLSLMIGLALACDKREEAAGPCPVIEIIAVAVPRVDSTGTIARDDTTTIVMARMPLTPRDIAGAKASQAGGQWAVSFTVNEDAAKRLHEFTGQHVGRSLAFVVDGKVHGGPRIASAVVGNRFPVAPAILGNRLQIDDFTRADAERLATAIKNGCLR